MLEQMNSGLIIFSKSIKRKIKGFDKLGNNLEDIKNTILNSAFVESKKYKIKHYNVSGGHFKQFYSRDFGMIVNGLLHLGYVKEVHSTIKYLLKVYKNNNKITTTISNDKPINFFNNSPDSLPFIFRSIRLALSEGFDKKEILKYKKFLQEQIKNYYEEFWDFDKYLIYKDKEFGSSKDHYIRKSSSYDNSAAIGLSIEIRKINLIFKEIIFKSPLNIRKAKKGFLDEFWNGEYFFDDLLKKEYVASDANIMPFYWNIFSDKDMKVKAMKSINKEKLDSILPVQYTNFRDKDRELFWPELFAPNYEGDSYWLHIGICYLEVLKDVDNKNFKRNLNNVKKMILKYQNFLEVFDKSGKPYSSPFYHCDEYMTWIAGFYYLFN